ncbi:hypothetical protein [Streptomyces syringium]|uniref:hypothetical protein n=1 Tax=Streptomyces syringium TaxID=76729 RepID=UPI003AAB7566
MHKPNENPYQQPGYQQPNPYQQPGYQQPNPYQQPAGMPGAPGHPGQPGVPQWTPPGAPGGPQPPRDNRRRTTMIAIGAAVAVVAAAVVTGVVVLKDDDEQPAAKGGDPKPASSAPASPSPNPSQGQSGAPDDNPRDGEAVKPVIDGWKVVVNGKRHNAFDVPADWTVRSPTMSTGFEGEDGKPLVTMSGNAVYKDGECAKNDHRAGAGTKGAQGAKSEGSAAEIESLNWVFAAFDQKKTGRFDTTKAKPFKSDHGITGYTASATVTGVKKTDKCVTDGKAFAVTYKDTSGDLATWILYAGTGFDGELPDDTIKKIMSSLRPLQSS